MLSVIILYTVFGSTFILSKILLAHSGPLCGVGAYMTLGGIILLLYSTYTQTKISLKKSNLWYYGQLAIFYVALPYSLRLWSLHYVSTIKAALLFNLSPFFTALFAFVIAQDYLSLRQITGLIIGFFGMIPVLLTHTGTESITVSSFLSTSEIALLISTASISYSLVIIQKLIKTNKCPVSVANGISMTVGGLVTLGLAYATEAPLIKTTIFKLLAYALLQAIVINVLCATWRTHLLKKYSSTFMAFASLVAPLSATLYGWFFYNEQLSWNFALSFVLVIMGLGVYYSNE